MSRSTSSSSSPSSYETERSDEQMHRLHLLDDPAALRLLLSAVSPDTEAMEDPNAAVRIAYPDDFKYVLGLHTAVRAAHRHDAPAHLGGRWLLLLAFAARECASNYTVWRDRTETVLTPDHALCSTAEYLLASLAPNERAALSRGISNVISAWLPTVADVCFPTADGSYNVWRAVHWELAATACFGRLYQKNFQIWHHRQCLLEAALNSIGTAAREVMRSQASFSAFLAKEAGLEFADFDERRQCEYVHLELDAKNYHVWLYRSWFVHTFRFLVQRPSLDALRRWAERQTVEPFAPDAEWFTGAERCLAPPYPDSPLGDELALTALLIRRDCLNNSAWCHRQYVVEHDLLDSLGGDEGGTSRSADPCDRLRLTFWVCLQEVRFGLQWAVAEPCNECPLVYAQHFAEYYQRLASSTGARGAGAGGWRASFQLVDYVQATLHAVVVRRAEEMEDEMTRLLALPADDTDKQAYIAMLYDQRCQALMDAHFQPTAALFASLHCFLRETWLRFLTQSQREEIGQRVPLHTYAYDGVPYSVLGDTDNWEPELISSGCLCAEYHSRSAGDKAQEAGEADEGGEELVELFIAREAMALAVGKELAHTDPIRFKYWRHTVHVVLNRLYD